MKLKQIDRKFYAAVMALALPIMLQTGITNFVSLLDNIMVGNLCTESMSGVSIANQLLFLYNLAIFGATSGVGIFTAQFHGQKNLEGIRHTFRFKLLLCLILTALSMVVLLTYGDTFIGLFLYESDQQGDLALTLSEGRRYLHTMLWGLIPYALSQCYASTLRETEESLLPMKAGFVAMAVNMGLNYVLIFGKLGMPALGVTGAAIATTTARVTECVVIIVFANRNRQGLPYLKDLFRKIALPSRQLVGGMMARALPLMVNEMLWAFATVALAQSYATRGLAVVAAFNIHSTVYNVASTSLVALGTAAGIISGKLLGANDAQGAISANKKLSVFAVVFSLLFTAILLALSPVFPLIYATTDQVRQLATQFMIVGALFLPVQAYLNVAYFTLRSGGCTGATFLFDCVFICGVSVPIAYFLSRYTDLSAVYLYVLVEGTNVGKSIVGYIMLRKEIWLRNIVNHH